MKQKNGSAVFTVIDIADISKLGPLEPGSELLESNNGAMPFDSGFLLHNKGEQEASGKLQTMT